MLGLLRNRSRPLIGVDVGTSSVKLVEFVDNGGGVPKLASYAITPLPNGAVSDGNIVEIEQVADAIRRAWKLLGTKEKNAALALPAAAVISRKINMQEGMSEAEMESQIEAEAHQYIPFALDEVNLDFQALGPSGDMVEVLLVAAKKERIEDRTSVIEEAGLKAIVMDVENNAIEAACEFAVQQLPGEGGGQTVMIVDIGSQLMNITVLSDNESVYTREQPFGGYQLTQAIVRHYGSSHEEAELAKRKGGLPDDYDSTLLQPFVQSLATEVARSAQLFSNSTQFSIDHIMLAGGCATIPGVDEAVAARTQINTIIANPFAGMPLAKNMKREQLSVDAPVLMVAFGLAMRRFDT